MARTFNTNSTDKPVPQVKATSLKSAVAGIPANFDPSKYTVKSGRQRASETRPFNLMLIGENGTGKTFTVNELLKLGFRVFYITTDMARQGTETVYSHMVDNPSLRPFLNNFREVALDFEGMTVFSREPKVIDPEIYSFDPDFLFWDGLTAYQDIQVQAELSDQDTNPDSDFKKNTWDDYRKMKNGTLYPVDRFLLLNNRETGREWNKIVTVGRKEIKRMKTVKDKDGNFVQVEDENFKKRVGPDLHTGAQPIIRGGFSLVLECTKRVVGGTEIFGFRRIGTGDAILETKSRGYNSIPALYEGEDGKSAKFSELWLRHIAPKHGVFEVPELSETISVTKPVPASSTISDPVVRAGTTEPPAEGAAPSPSQEAESVKE